MPSFAIGHVATVDLERPGLQRIIVELEGRSRPAIALTELCGPVAVGDRVAINTTALQLDLGTGGIDFVAWNLDNSYSGRLSGGHILKLRYTPLQLDIVAAEAQDSPHHEELVQASDLKAMPVVVCALHSQMPVVVSVLKTRLPRLRVVYVMTDGGSLPMVLSDHVAALRQRGLLSATVSAGHAFGGDLEAVNIFSALLVARVAAGAQAVVVGPGPGLVGTGTRLGFAMDQGLGAYAADVLGGRCIIAPRISFADKRERHSGVSHHTLTALSLWDSSRYLIALPHMLPGRLDQVRAQIEQASPAAAAGIEIVDASETAAAMSSAGLAPQTMGRTYEEDPSFFEAAGAAAIVCSSLVSALAP